MRLAIAAHEGQTARDGGPQLGHVERVVEQLRQQLAGSPLRDRAVTAAFLHDTVEANAGVTPDTLRSRGFDEDMVAVVDLLTRPKHVPYLEYMQRLVDAPGAAGELARIVKTADLADNAHSSEQRGEEVHLARYRAAQAMLAEAGERGV
jgi:(p)ppGpp synthase/HD superfamily hydrolase